MRTMPHSDPRRLWPVRMLLAALAAACLLLSACSADAEDATDRASDTTTDEQGTEAAAPEDGDDAGGEGQQAASVGEFCAMMRDRVAQSGLMDAGSMESLEDVDAMVGEATQVYNDLAESAPEEIADDVAVIADTFSQQREALENLDDPEAAADMADSLSPEFIEAQTRISEWKVENC